jgi:hypothetical protein
VWVRYAKLSASCQKYLDAFMTNLNSDFQVEGA